jgi:hypothetical protein
MDTEMSTDTKQEEQDSSIVVLPERVDEMLESCRSAINEFRSVLETIQELCTQQQTGQGNNVDSAALLSLCTAQEQAAQLLLKIRHSHRAVRYISEGIVLRTQQQKTGVDERLLALQSLQYEEAHLRKEIAISRNFR